MVKLDSLPMRLLVEDRVLPVYGYFGDFVLITPIIVLPHSHIDDPYFPEICAYFGGLGTLLYHPKYDSRIRRVFVSRLGHAADSNWIP